YPTARRVELTRSYRSTPTIVGAALQAIAPGSLVPDRALAAVRPDVPDGRIAVHRASSEHDEAALIAETIERLLGGAALLSAADQHLQLSFSDFAVLYRTSAQAQPVADALARRGFPFQRRTHDRLVDRPGVRALLHTMREEAEGSTSVAAAL